MSMTLHWSPRSPFVRKVMIVLHETGQVEQVDTVRSVVGAHLSPNEAVLADNPLGKIPTLLTEDGTALFDSRVVCEYLDMRAGTGLFPTDPAQRFQQLRWQTLGDGLLDILLVWRTELTRPSGPWDALTGSWLSKVRATMERLEAEAAQLAGTPFGIGQIAISCALGQLDFRWQDCDWRAAFPQLAQAEAVWASRFSVAAVPVVDDGPEGADITVGQLRFAGRS